MTERTFIHEIEDKYGLESKAKVYPKLFTDRCYKRKCVKCKKKTKNLNSKIFKTKNGRFIMQSKGVECGIKKSRFVKKQEAKRLLSNLGVKTPLTKIPLLNVLYKK